MNTRIELIGTIRRCVRAFYRIFIEPKQTNEDDRRHELIFNVIATTLFFLVCLLDLSILYADLISLDKGGFTFFTFTVFVTFFGLLLLLSRKGHTTIAAYLFIGLYFLATTYGVFIWGTAVPLSLLSYGAIIVMTSIILGTTPGFISALSISSTLIILGFLETHGIINSDISWRLKPLQFKDTIEDSFVYGMIATVSWLSNKEIERSLNRARKSEKALKEERDLLEVKVEERTKQLKTAEVERVSQLYRFVEFGRLSSGIFHDLLNPLSVVSLSVERLDDSPGDTEARKHIEKAIKASKRMEMFIQTAKKQLDSTHYKADFSANTEISDAIDLLLHKSKKAGVEINFIVGKDALIHGNPVRFFQIIVNLLSNAIDSYFEKSITEEKIVTVLLIPSTDSTKIIITDNGSGISPEISEKIFEPFFTTKQNRPRQESGFGLGLSTTKDIIEKDFNGTISLKSTIEKGSVFTISIPKSHENKSNLQTHTEKG